MSTRADHKPSVRLGRPVTGSRAGVSIIYMVMVLGVLFGLGGLAMDGLMVRAVKTDLQCATDAAALYGASGIRNIGVNGVSAAFANAKQAFNDNFAGRTIPAGEQVTLNTSDIELGTWNTTTRVFAPTSDATVANALRVTARRTTANGNPIKLYLLPVMPGGKNYCDLVATSVALLIPGAQKQTDIAATSNPWLAGSPGGTVANNNGNPHNNPDYAPDACPVKIAGLSFSPGQILTFDGINGGANNFPTDARFNADGNFDWMVNNKYSALHGPENGKSDIKAPINCLIGVFLGNGNPDDGTYPPSLDFSTPSQRDFSQLEPALKQTFFIGDGLRDNDTTQTFKVPAGATRLFIGTMDEYEWNNNQGGFSITTHATGKVMLVK